MSPEEPRWAPESPPGQPRPNLGQRFGQPVYCSIQHASRVGAWERRNVNVTEPGLTKSRLLIAVSSPWAAEKLTAPVADLARRLDAEAIVAHVAQLQDEDEHESDARQRGEQTLKLLADGLKQAGVTVEGLMLFSDD